MIKNTLPDKSRNSQSLKKYLQQFESFLTNVPLAGEDLLRCVVQVVLFTVLWFKWSVKKLCVTKVLLEVWEIFLRENNRNYNSYRFSCKFTFILCLSFLTNQKQESGFQEVACLVTRNISFFCLQRVLFYFKAIQNSTDFSKGIFLHAIPVCIIVSCLYGTSLRRSEDYQTLSSKIYY